MELLSAHFDPKLSEIVRRFMFHKREQKQKESIATYVSELKKIAEHCNFGNSLETMLRDRLVCGIHDERVQRRLLAESELTFKSAFDLILAAETTKSQIVKLRSHATNSSGSENSLLKTSESGRLNTKKNDRQHNVNSSGTQQQKQ